MSGIRAILWLVFSVPLCSFCQPNTIPDQIDSNLAETAVAGNTWTVLIENRDGSVVYYQRNPTTLTYRVLFKNSLSEPVWQTLGSDVTATNTSAMKTDPGFVTVPQRFYRIMLQN